MAYKLPASLSSEHIDFLFAELNDSINSGEPFIFHNEEVAREFSSILSEYYPDHLFMAADGFQAICVTQKQSETLIEHLQERIASLLSRSFYLEDQIDFINRRFLTLPKN